MKFILGEILAVNIQYWRPHVECRTQCWGDLVVLREVSLYI